MGFHEIGKFMDIGLHNVRIEFGVELEAPSMWTYGKRMIGFVFTGSQEDGIRRQLNN